MEKFVLEIKEKIGEYSLSIFPVVTMGTEKGKKMYFLKGVINRSDYRENNSGKGIEWTADKFNAFTVLYKYVIEEFRREYEEGNLVEADILGKNKAYYTVAIGVQELKFVMTQLYKEVDKEIQRRELYE